MSATGRRRGAAFVAAAVVPLLAAGCGGEERTTGTAAPLGKELGGSVAQLVLCSDWTGGTRDRQLATIEAIRAQVNRKDTGVESTPLTDAEATALFDRACAAPYASGFRLSVLYVRAAGFAPLLRDPAAGEQ